jgi:sugar transferase (PEP-CTERM/EpsH1 system associated)
LRVLWVKSGGLVPLDTGGKIRSFNLLKELARKHEVTLFTFYGSLPEDAHAQLEKYFARVICVPLPLPEKRGVTEALEYARNLFSWQPYTVTKYCRPVVARALLELLRAETFDVMICDFLFSAGVIPWEWPCPKVLFTHNVEEQIWRRHFQVTRNPVWKTVAWREYRTLRSAERRYVQRADHVLTVSENDRRFFASYAEPDKMTVVPTGVDTDYFQPGAETVQPETLVFTGSMDWMPNEDAILYFIEAILPRLQREFPDIELRVVGRSPSQRLLALAAQEKHLHVTGAVEDIRPFVLTSAVYVVPLRIGGGTRIKIFEAMAMGMAVVSTSVGAEGLPVRHDENIILADEPAEFAAQVARLLRDSATRERIGRAARALVEKNYAWRSVAGVFDTVFERVTAKPSEAGSRSPAGTAAGT